MDIYEPSAKTSVAGLNEARNYFDEIVVDGTSDVDVKVRARRGGAITGRVAYADGDPAINVRINIVRKREGRNLRFVTGSSPVAYAPRQTGDRGMYRITGLPPGEYIISASEMNTNPDSFNVGEGEGGPGPYAIDALASTFYPNATKSKDSTPVKVEAGNEATDVNITLIERSTHTVGGTVTTRRDNQPLAQTQVNIRSKEDAAMLATNGYEPTGQTVLTDDQGRWSFPEVPDGTYIVNAEPSNGDYYSAMAENAQGNMNNASAGISVAGQQGTVSGTVNLNKGKQQRLPQDKRKLVNRQMEITVAGGDVANINIDLAEGRRISGVVTVEGGKSSPPENVSVNAETKVDGKSLGTQTQFTPPNKLFVIDGVAAGDVYLNVSLADLPGKYYVKSINAGGVDNLREPIKLGETGDIANVQIVLSGDVATLTGRVLGGAPNNTPLVGAGVSLVPIDAKPSRNESTLPRGFTDARGVYTIVCAPGEYFIVAQKPGEESSALTAASTNTPVSTTQQRVILQSNERKTLDVIVTTGNR